MLSEFHQDEKETCMKHLYTLHMLFLNCTPYLINRVSYLMCKKWISYLFTSIRNSAKMRAALSTLAAHGLTL